MTLDVFAAIVLTILSYLGWRSGALGQLLRIVGAAAVLFFGKVAAAFVRDVLFGGSGFAEPLVEVGSYFLGATLLYAAVVLSGWFVIKTMRAATPTLATMDRAVGATLGAVKASILVYVIVAGALLLASPLAKQDPEDAMHLRDGYITGMAEQYDIFSPWRVEELDDLHRLLQSGMKARDQGVEHVLREHERAADLLRRSGVQELLDDEELREAIESGHAYRTLADERVRELLNDPAFMELLQELDLAEIERTVEEASTQEKPAAAS